MPRKTFLPRKPPGAVLHLGKLMLPYVMDWQCGGLEVQTSPEDLASLRALKKKRLLLLPNHPTHFDPMVMLEVSKRVDENLNFVAAREVFDKSRAWGWLLQHCGVYSLVRGAVDRDSFAMTQQILADGKQWLVIFIEGESTMENDSVIPFESGVLSLALRTQDKLPPDASPLHTAVVAMRTTYKPGIEHTIAASIARLETAVGITPQPAFVDWPTTRKRLNAVGHALLESVERTYLLTPKPADTIDTRMNALKSRLLSKMEAFLDVPPAKDASFLDRIRIVRNRMDRIVHTYDDDPATQSPYERRLLELRRRTFAELYADLSRLINFLTFRGDYLENASPERFAEVTIRLEQEILGKPQILHPRTVTVRLGTIRNLAHCLPAFRTDKRTAATTLTEELETEMKSLLKA